MLNHRNTQHTRYTIHIRCEWCNSGVGCICNTHQLQMKIDVCHQKQHFIRLAMLLSSFPLMYTELAKYSMKKIDGHSMHSKRKVRNGAQKGKSSPSIQFSIPSKLVALSALCHEFFHLIATVQFRVVCKNIVVLLTCVMCEPFWIMCLWIFRPIFMCFFLFRLPISFDIGVVFSKICYFRFVYRFSEANVVYVLVENLWSNACWSLVFMCFPFDFSARNTV